MELAQRLEDTPSVALIGPRQVGKATLEFEIAEARPSIYLDLESDADRAKLAEPELYLSGHEDKLVILDEVHRLPGLFRILRGLIDVGRRKGCRAGRFLLLGSASIDLLRQGESLAGCISYLEMHPLDALEVGQGKPRACGYIAASLTVSFPVSDRASQRWRQDFIRSYLEHDIQVFGPRIAAGRCAVSGRCWRIINRASSTLPASRGALGSIT